MIPSSFKEFGYVEIPDYCPSQIRVYESAHSLVTISTSGQPMRAYWSGDRIIVEMDNGSVRSYHSLDSGGFDIAKYPTR